MPKNKIGQDTLKKKLILPNIKTNYKEQNSVKLAPGETNRTTNWDKVQEQTHASMGNWIALGIKIKLDPYLTPYPK